MKKRILIVLLTTLSFNSYSQIEFEKGYLIDNSGKRTDCFIQNMDWKNNPDKFEYKLTGNSELKIGTIKTIKEFTISNTLKYKRFLVEIDKSSSQINKLTNSKKPEFKEETLFLKSLLEGKANLYFYEGNNLTRYFYSVDNSDVKQLIYKSYRTSDNKVEKNNSYKQQLWVDLNCKDIVLNDAKNTDYRKGDLINYFAKYNSCVNSDYVTFEEKHKRDLFNLNIRPGLNISFLSIDNRLPNMFSSQDIDFGNKLSFRFGIEAEYILPFNKNKWGLIVEPTYQYYKAKKELISETVSVDYNSIELPFGVRYYFFVNENSKIFINGSYIIDFDLNPKNSKIDFEESNDLIIKPKTNFAFGFGYNYKNKYNIEIRYGISRDLLDNFYFYTDSHYNTISVILGYTLF